MSELPAFFKIAPPPLELGLRGDDDDDDHYKWWRHYDRDRGDVPSPIQGAEAFPEAIAVEPPEALRTTKMFACSGSIESQSYREATRFRTMPEMGWEEARVALRRLAIVCEKQGYAAADEVRLAEFALTADGYAGFAGKKGDHAAGLRDELAEVRNRLLCRLSAKLMDASHQATRLARPIASHGENMTSYHAAREIGSTIAKAFWTAVPAASDQWVPVAKATPDQILAALDYLRSTLTVWEAHRPVASVVVNRLQSSDLPPASDYAAALHTAEMLVFTREKLLSLYAGIIYSMPIYRLYPATSEAEAIGLWWPWGRPAPLIDGAPPRPPKPRKQTLDPSLITATRPENVVREVMAKTGINRTTVQRMTAARRAEMRQARKNAAEHLLYQGLSKSETARRVGLSASRISAMFKGQKFRKWLSFDPEDDDDE